MASLVAINLNKYAAQNVPLMLPHNHRPTEPHLLKVRRPIAVCFDTCVCQVGVGGCTDGCTDGWVLQVYTMVGGVKGRDCDGDRWVVPAHRCAFCLLCGFSAECRGGDGDGGGFGVCAV